MSARDHIAAKLTKTFEPVFLDVLDESDQHSGHSGARPGGETHFRVRIATSHFDGLSRIAQHRAVNSALEAELAGSVHALAIEVLPSSGPF